MLEGTGTHSQMSTMEGSDGSNSDSDSNSNSNTNTTNIGGVIFILNNLSFDFDPEDDFAGTVPYLPYRLENLAATYISPLEQILSSRLNAAGFIQAIYVNFGPRGYYKLNPSTSPITRPAAFEAQLHDLFQIGTVSNPDNNNEEVWKRMANLSSIMSTLPENCKKIGCVHGTGPHSQGSMNYRDYITAASDEQTCVFVVGQIDTQIQGYIDDFVKVSDYNIVASQCLSRIISEMEIKWDVS